MFDQIVDVAAIMRHIKASVAENQPQNEYSQDDSFSETDKEIKRIHEFLENTRCSAVPYLDMGMRIPAFSRFCVPVRKLFYFIARLIRKATLFMTREQSIVNHSVDSCIKALVESDQAMFMELRMLHADTIIQQKQMQQRDVELRVIHEQIERHDEDLKNCLLKYHQQQTQMEKERLSFKQQLAQQQHYTENMNELLQKSQKQILKLEELLGEQQSFINKLLEQRTHISPELYLQFENWFRGTHMEIKDRLQYYFSHCLRGIRQDEKMIDLGCGRGEWIELLKENGYDPIGIDINEAMVNECKKNNLHAICSEALEYLEKQLDESSGLISAFQVIEHMEMINLEKLIQECQRVLRPGGKMILETPNIQNIEVGSNNFYSDPTHIRPVHQEYLKFLAHSAGFTKAEIVYWKQEEIDSWWNTVVGNDESDFAHSTIMRTVAESVRKAFYVSPDYALIATK